MFIFELTTDLAAVRSILTNPTLYYLMADDFMPDPSALQLTNSPGLTYVLVKLLGEILGVVLVVRRNQIHCELHVCILPQYWGRTARKAARAFFPWFWDTFPQYVRAIGNIPDCNEAALNFARSFGLKAFGRNPRVFQKGGKRYDEIWVGIDRPVTT